MGGLGCNVIDWGNGGLLCLFKFKALNFTYLLVLVVLVG